MEMLVTLVSLALGGLSWLAIQEPELFRAAFPYLLGITLVIFVGAATWDNATITAHTVLIPYLLDGKYKEIDAALETIQIPFAWLVGGYFGFSLYVVILRGIVDYRASKPSSSSGG